MLDRRAILLPLLVVAILGMGWLDWETGPRISFALFYLVPILVAGWYWGRAPAWIVTACACLAQLLADVAWAGEAPGGAGAAGP